MSDDIVWRLRECAFAARELMLQAADKIERLRIDIENKELEFKKRLTKSEEEN